MKKFILGFLAFFMVITIIPQSVEAKTYDLGGGWRMDFHAPNTGKKYYHIHIRHTRKNKHKCIRLDNFKECDKKSGKGKIPTSVLKKAFMLPKVKSVLINLNYYNFKKIKAKVPKWVWRSSSKLASFVTGLLMSRFKIGSGIAGAVWKVVKAI